MIDNSKILSKTLASEQATRLIRIKDVCKLTGISRSHIYQLCSQDRFPKSVDLVPGGSIRGWVESEINNYINERIAAREEA